MSGALYAAWRPMLQADLPSVVALADRIHPDYPEDPAVLAEKLHLFPHGCLALEERGTARVIGYCFSHPWTRGAPPRLNTALHALPATPTTYFVHDLAVDPDWRKRRLAAAVGPLLEDASRRARLSHLSLVSVHGTTAFWQRLGFVETRDPALQEAVRASYGDEARHMEQLIDLRLPQDR